MSVITRPKLGVNAADPSLTADINSDVVLADPYDPKADLTWPTPNGYSQGENFFRYTIVPSNKIIVVLELHANVETSSATARRPFFFSVDVANLFKSNLISQTTLSINSIRCIEARGELKFSCPTFLYTVNAQGKETLLASKDHHCFYQTSATEPHTPCNAILHFDASPISPDKFLFVNNTTMDMEDASRFAALRIETFTAAASNYDVTAPPKTTGRAPQKPASELSHKVVPYHTRTGAGSYEAHPVAWMAEFNIQANHRQFPESDLANRIIRQDTGIAIPTNLYNKYIAELTEHVQSTECALVPGSKLVIKCEPAALDPSMRHIPTITAHTPTIHIELILTPYSVIEIDSPGITPHELAVEPEQD